MRTSFIAAILAICLFSPAAVFGNTPPTVLIKGSGNLDQSSTLVSAPTGVVTFDQLETDATESASVVVYDSLRAAHAVLAYAFHTSAQTWEVLFYVDGSQIVNSVSGTPFLVGTATLEFDSNGERVTPIPEVDTTLVIEWANGATLTSIEVQLASVTAVNGESNLALVAEGSGGSNASCRYAESCVSESLDIARTTCLGEAALCNARDTSFAVSAEELALRAIEAEKCRNASAVGSRRCKACYEKAGDRIPDEDRALFRGTLNRAKGIIARRARSACS